MYIFFTFGCHLTISVENRTRKMHQYLQTLMENFKMIIIYWHKLGEVDSCLFISWYRNPIACIDCFSSFACWFLVKWINSTEPKGHYPMTKTQFMYKRGVQKCAISALLPWCSFQVMGARTLDHVEITHFPTQCAIRTWKALSLRLRPHASQSLLLHLIQKCAIST